MRYRTWDKKKGDGASVNWNLEFISEGRPTNFIFDGTWKIRGASWVQAERKMSLSRKRFIRTSGHAIEVIHAHYVSPPLPFFLDYQLVFHYNFTPHFLAAIIRVISLLPLFDGYHIYKDTRRKLHAVFFLWFTCDIHMGKWYFCLVLYLSWKFLTYLLFFKFSLWFNDR